jgi:formylglycine-generating enzyme required for sulfatase activity
MKHLLPAMLVFMVLSIVPGRMCGQGSKQLYFNANNIPHKAKKYFEGMKLIHDSFYISDHEITNKEYKEFIFWVKDSMLRYTIGEDFIITDDNGFERLDWSKEIKDYIHDTDYAALFKKFDRTVTHDKIIYSYGDCYNYLSIPVYPDSTVISSCNELKKQSYFNNPLYIDSPVVGVSWRQANAYCNWRTLMINRVIENKNIGKKEKAASFS